LHGKKWKLNGLLAGKKNGEKVPPKKIEPAASEHCQKKSYTAKKMFPKK